MTQTGKCTVFQYMEPDSLLLVKCTINYVNALKRVPHAVNNRDMLSSIVFIIKTNQPTEMCKQDAQKFKVICASRVRL